MFLDGSGIYAIVETVTADGVPGHWRTVPGTQPHRSAWSKASIPAVITEPDITLTDDGINLGLPGTMGSGTPGGAVARRLGGTDPADIRDAFGALSRVRSPADVRHLVEELPTLGSPAFLTALRHDYMRAVPEITDQR